MTHHRKRVLAATGFAVIAVVVAALLGVPALATPPSGLVNVALARGTDVSHGTLPLQVGTDVAMAQITVQPGGSSGWHSHPGGAIIVVKTGTLTVYRSTGGRDDDDDSERQCQIHTYSEGNMFIERPGEVDEVINTGTIPYVLFVTFPRVPQGEPPRIDESDPGTCPGI